MSKLLVLQGAVLHVFELFSCQSSSSSLLLPFPRPLPFHLGTSSCTFASSSGSGSLRISLHFCHFAHLQRHIVKAVKAMRGCHVVGSTVQCDNLPLDLPFFCSVALIRPSMPPLSVNCASGMSLLRVVAFFFLSTCLSTVEPAGGSN